MLLLGVQNIRKYFGPEPVLAGVSFELRAGHRLGLVGPNGAGKSTLLRIIAGLEEADAGQVQLASGARIGFLEQHPTFEPGATVWDLARDALRPLLELAAEAEQLAHDLAAASDPDEHDRLGQRFDFVQHELARLDAYHLDHKIERVLQGLGFAEASFRQPAATLSGGQQNRLILARLLLARPEIMLLDEPSNHLDIEATQWLEKFLVDSGQTLIVVSHDRYFLDRVTTHTAELFNGTIDVYVGGFSAYWRQKAERLEVQRRTFEKQQEEIAKLEDFIRRNHYGQKHAQAEDRRKKLERIERVPPPRDIVAPPMGFPPASRTGDIVLRVERLAKGFGQPLFQDLSFDILRGERWGVLGPNGSGKTTLLRCLVGRLPLDDGRITLGAGVKFGYFDQLLDCVDSDALALDAVRPDHKEFVEQQRRDLLARFGVTGDMVFQRVASLSGGERNRTALARLAASDANLLILDEPTNHLDLWARDALERSLKAFGGTVLLVSHDRYFLNQVVDHLLVVEPGRFRVIEGNYDTYQHLARQGLVGVGAIEKASTTANGDGRDARGAAKPAARKRRFPYRKTPEIEHDIAACEARIAALHDALGSPEVLRDGDRIKAAVAELEQRQAELSQLYEHWEEASELN